MPWPVMWYFWQEMGHETYQDVMGHRTHMDERELIGQILEEEDAGVICGRDN